MVEILQRLKTDQNAPLKPREKLRKINGQHLVNG
jgi:hypothetical protein